MRSRNVQKIPPKGEDKIVESFQTLKMLGKGSFGVVKLVRDKGTLARPIGAQGQVFAMKVIRKFDMLRNCQEGHLWAERDLLVRAEGCPW